ncbi:MAG: hypothetical protein IJM36_03850 [Acholeplasmatales bacterium]|nr:hypothetical protein [Acholeplasmatales bacterium]
MAKWLDSQSKLIKILLFIPFWGWAVGAVYRIFKFIDSKEPSTLVGAILDIIGFIGFFLSIIDLVTIIIHGEVTVLSK